MKEAYERSLERINASHILIAVKPNAAAKDTLKAYNKIMEARDKALAGKESFASVAKLYSEDPSVAKNGGDLGWFSVFRMVYPFEDAAYKTKVGEVSKPFRTQFGYHIVKVNEREKTLGEVTVAHIMVAINDKRTEEDDKSKIEDINQQLLQGVSFAALAKEYSDDPTTAVKGGELKRFGQGALNSKEFEKTAFGLKENGEVSKPIKTQYGWHIIKLIDKHDVKTYEEYAPELTKRVEKDSRARRVTASFIQKLKDKYAVKKNDKAIQYFGELLPETFATEPWSIPEISEMKKSLFSIREKQYLYQDFAKFLKQSQRRRDAYADNLVFVHDIYKQFESDAIQLYYKDHLEQDNPEFASVLKEYKEGLLLFDLMESKIWNIAKTDSVGLQKFYDDHKENYVANEMYKVLKASSSKNDALEKVESLLKKKKTVEEIKAKVNKGDVDVVIFSEEEIYKNNNEILSGKKIKKGEIISVKEKNFHTLFLIKEIIPSRIKTFDETKGAVINDFQKKKEDEWLKELKSKYSIQINNETLEKVKKELSI